MQLRILLIAAIAPAVLALSSNDDIKEEFKQFKAMHGKKYHSNIEESFRMKIFMENKQTIARHNERYARGEVSYTLALNQFSDLLPDEFASMMNGYKQSNSLGASFGNDSATFLAPPNAQLPMSVDWRQYGAVTPVKYQGQCGSCWAFSTTGALEGQHFLKTGQLVSLSEQNLIDCSHNGGNNGCHGGFMDAAFQYIQDNGGIDTEISYPYEAEDDQCQYTPEQTGATVSGLMDIPTGSESDLQAAVATVGPIAVAIDVLNDLYQYNGGVYYNPECSSTSLDHAVLAVGYGTTEEGVDYWILKNSWGTEWGDDGYFLMARNQDNHCSIATKASYPLV